MAEQLRSGEEIVIGSNPEKKAKKRKEKELIIEALMFMASCDICGNISHEKIDAATELAVKMAKEINFKSKDISYIANEGMVYEDRHILEKFKPYITKEFLVREE